MLDLQCCPWALSGCDKRGLLFIAVPKFLIAVTSRVGSTSRFQQVQLAGLVFVVLERERGRGHSCFVDVESSQTRSQTRVPCICKWILTHCTTREVPAYSI